MDFEISISNVENIDDVFNQKTQNNMYTIQR